MQDERNKSNTPPEGSLGQAAKDILRRIIGVRASLFSLLSARAQRVCACILHFEILGSTTVLILFATVVVLSIVY